MLQKINPSPAFLIYEYEVIGGAFERSSVGKRDPENLGGRAGLPRIEHAARTDASPNHLTDLHRFDRLQALSGLNQGPYDQACQLVGPEGIEVQAAGSLGLL